MPGTRGGGVLGELSYLCAALAIVLIIVNRILFIL